MELNPKHSSQPGRETSVPASRRSSEAPQRKKSRRTVLRLGGVRRRAHEKDAEATKSSTTGERQTRRSPATGGSAWEKGVAAERAARTDDTDPQKVAELERIYLENDSSGKPLSKPEIILKRVKSARRRRH